uniref:Uncharacterized protein n=1 Tax=Kwoniella dejecticola CBS 10117 TaxID=1296121 RepID=A0A1A5ZZB7_9TREE|nr:uncharacterized protein I303_06718 [Kwoniella dejecticola CBS 10117]OBR83159.1 hypothetical protein I303_06718 [Kwoniella dejecticola CBS 10117]
MAFGMSRRQKNQSGDHPSSGPRPDIDSTSNSASPHDQLTTRNKRPEGFVDVTPTSPSALSPSATNISLSIMGGANPPKRRSWFSFRRNKQLLSSSNSIQQQSIPEGEQNNHHLVTPFQSPPSAWGNNEERLRPIQFQPNRIQTLYVSKSERDLYLAAMSQLDELPPPLPLWSDRAPELPKLNTQLTPLKAPSIPNGSTGKSGRHARSISEGGSTAFHPLTARPLSPKLVISPQMGRSGLMIRDEFIQRSDPPRSMKHALMAFISPSGLRFTGFPPSTISAVDLVLQENWDQGVSARSEGAAELGQRVEEDKFTWKVELEGKVWRRKGSQELDSIRLLIALFSILGIHGWTLVETVQTGGSKANTHNLLFSYSAKTSMNPPLFFALSLPLPDRLSLISPPPKVTPAIISALRQAIGSSPTKTSKHSRNGTNTTGVTVTPDSDEPGNERQRPPKVNWNNSNPPGIKLEGWVHDGVYRFWIDGMRRWLGGTVKRKVVENLHPNLLIAIINNITGLHFELTASIPLLPITKGRDVLIFSSQPASGLSVIDSYVPKEPSIAGSESPVLVSPSASFPAQEVLDKAFPPQGHTGNPRQVDPENRQLPWTSVLSDQPSRSVSSPKPSPPRLPPRGEASAGDRKRTGSRESSKPLFAAPSASANSTPKHKNVLLKKNSLTRRRSVSADHSGQNSAQSRSINEDGRNSSQGTYAGHIYGQGPEEGNRHFHVTNPDNASERWSFIDPPPNVGKLGVTMYNSGPHTHHYTPHTGTTPGRTSGEDGTRESRSHEDSVYADAQPTLPHHLQHSDDREPLRYVPIQDVSPGAPDFTGDAPIAIRTFAPTSPESEFGLSANGSEIGHPSEPLALGQPILSDQEEDTKTVPLKDADSPERRGRANIVDLGNAIQSVHGSVGYLQSMISGISGHNGKRNSTMTELDHPTVPPVPSVPSVPTVPAQPGSHIGDRGQDEDSVPRPEIRIIDPSLIALGTGFGNADANESLPPVPQRPDPAHIPESTLPAPVVNGEAAGRGYKYTEWERKGKVKEGMRRIWDENDNAWKDIPAKAASGHSMSNAEGVGSGRTRIDIGRG